MPATVEDLTNSLPLSRQTVEGLAAFVSASTASFGDLVDVALERLGGSVPPWPLLGLWNRWCFEQRFDFFVWHPVPADVSDRQRLEVLVHTLLSLAVKEDSLASYRRAGVKEVEVAMAGDDCQLCDEHRHHIVPIDDTATAAALPPFHPGCRCRMLPRLD